MKRQKKIRNISYKDIVDLDITIARFIIPRLKFFKKKLVGNPPEFTFEEWKAMIDKMILAFTLILDNSEPDFGDLNFHTEKADDGHWKMTEDPNSTFDRDAYEKWHKEKEAKIKEGLQLFAKYFQHLWL